LLHYIKGILEASFVLTSSDFILQTLDSLILLSAGVDVLVLSGFYCFEFFGPFIFFTGEPLYTVFE